MCGGCLRCHRLSPERLPILQLLGWGMPAAEEGTVGHALRARLAPPCHGAKGKTEAQGGPQVIWCVGGRVQVS